MRLHQYASSKCQVNSTKQEAHGTFETHHINKANSSFIAQNFKPMKLGFVRISRTMSSFSMVR